MFGMRPESAGLLGAPLRLPCVDFRPGIRAARPGRSPSARAAARGQDRSAHPETARQAADRAVPGRGTATTVWKFVDEDTFTWDLVAKDKRGKVLLDMSGRS